MLLVLFHSSHRKLGIYRFVMLSPTEKNSRVLQVLFQDNTNKELNSMHNIDKKWSLTNEIDCEMDKWIKIIYFRFFNLYLLFCWILSIATNISWFANKRNTTKKKEKNAMKIISTTFFQLLWIVLAQTIYYFSFYFFFFCRCLILDSIIKFHFISYSICRCIRIGKCVFCLSAIEFNLECE